MSIEEKQEYLRDNILDKGYDANLFAEYLITKKGEEGANIASWSLEDLRMVVQEFIEKQTTSLYGAENTISPLSNPKEIKEEKSNLKEIKEVAQNQTNEIKEEINEEKDKNKEEKIEKKDDKEKKGEEGEKEENDLINLQKKINPIIYGIIGPESLPCKKVEKTPLSSIKNPIITVSSPEKKEGGFFSKSYITYLITTSELNLKVRKRYSDFVWLHQTLFDLYPYIVVPPVPKKNKIGADRFSDAFINKRMRYLEKFLNWLVSNPLMKYNQLFYDFLSIEDEKEFNKKKNFYQKMKPPMNLKSECFSCNGRMRLGVNEEKETYFENIKDNTFYNQELLNKLNLSIKQLKIQMDIFIQKVEEVTQVWDELFKNSSKYYDDINITNTYGQMNKLWVNWVDSLKKQNSLIFVDVREYFKYIRNNYREMKNIAHITDNYKSIYYKVERNLVYKKEELFKRGDISKWELDSQEKTNANVLLQDKSSALFKIAAKDTSYCIQKRLYYGYYLNRTIEEFERIRTLNGQFHKDNHMNYCRKLSDIVGEFHKNIAENLTALFVGEKAIRKNENQN